MFCLVLMSKVICVWKVIGWSAEAVGISGPTHLCVQLSGGFWPIDSWGKYARICSCIVCCFTVLLLDCRVPLLEFVHLSCWCYCCCCCCLFENCTSFSWNLSDVMLCYVMLCYVTLRYVTLCYVMFVPIQEVLSCLAAAYIQMCTDIYIYAFIKRTDLRYFMRKWKSSPSCSLCVLLL
jgi:hypothetical protein